MNVMIIKFSEVNKSKDKNHEQLVLKSYEREIKNQEVEITNHEEVMEKIIRPQVKELSNFTINNNKIRAFYWAIIITIEVILIVTYFTISNRNNILLVSIIALFASGFLPEIYFSLKKRNLKKDSFFLR